MLFRMLDANETVPLRPAVLLDVDEVVVFQLRQVVFPEVSQRHRIVVRLLVPRVQFLLDESVLLGEDLVQRPLVRVQLRDRLLSDLAFRVGDRLFDESPRDRGQALARGHARRDPQAGDRLPRVSFGEVRDAPENVLVDGVRTESLASPPREDLRDRVLAVRVEVHAVGDADPGGDSLVEICEEVDLAVCDTDPRNSANLVEVVEDLVFP